MRDANDRGYECCLLSDCAAVSPPPPARPPARCKPRAASAAVGSAATQPLLLRLHS